MTPDEIETYAAEAVLLHAHVFARNGRAEDQAAATAAILCRALELATPELSPQARARLFLSEELPPSSLQLEYDLGTYGDWISDEN